ncbi:MAG: hypothetical protein CVV64_19740 [Candidatus Wallbacteria bacterium HGW-Wallbacteria-1]|jgi:hypothetical protein|uniref:Fimbrial assembly protein n=1 Tax=Candidatus Wallbacteria bacterium HGW-Wallbacteria-1 TaxID=2013854 RepID=A0A2N1PIW2_9BACT|nr:MAG: hypothetical protein CVV64_19740 [Candidatus Wallbacteria bacterium HGW-Wallbacteria-1]
MIRTNLARREIKARDQTMKWSVPVLSAILAVQLLVVGLRYHEITQQQEEFATVEQQLSALKDEAAAFAISEDLQQLAGKVAARNNWLLDRRNSPLARLAKLQKDCPNNVSFVSYGADLTGGKIILTSPDLNSVSGWLNSHFGNLGNISVVGREGNLLVLQFLWSG